MASALRNTPVLTPEQMPSQWGTYLSLFTPPSVMAACQVTRAMSQSDSPGSVPSSSEAAQTTEENM